MVFYNIAAAKNFERESAITSFQIQVTSTKPIISTSFRHADTFSVMKNVWSTADKGIQLVNII